MLLFRWRQVLSVVKSKGVRVVFPYGNLHPQVCPLDFSSAPCDGRVDGDDIFNTVPVTKKTDTTVTIVTLPESAIA